MIKKNIGSKETFATNSAAQNTMLNEVYMEKAIGGSLAFKYNILTIFGGKIIEIREVKVQILSFKM